MSKLHSFIKKNVSFIVKLCIDVRHAVAVSKSTFKLSVLMSCHEIHHEGTMACLITGILLFEYPL